MSESDLLNEFREEKNKKMYTASVPSGWEPYSEHTDQIGEAIVRLPAPNATARDLLISAGFDPEQWRIAGPINTRRWMRFDQEWLYYYKFDVVAGETKEVEQRHIDDLVADIRANRKKSATGVRLGGNDAFLFLMSDLQIGKAENGLTTEDTISRYLDAVDQTAVRIRELRQTGRKIPHLAIVGLGDIVESCNNYYSNQLFIVDRNQRDQNKIARELIYYTIDTLSPGFDQVTVASVGGNHGENRNEGKMLTDEADNADVACFEAVKEAYERAGVTNINWVIPQHELSFALTLGGVDVGFTHGHIFRKGSTIQQKAVEWFRGQVFGGGAVKDAKILVSGHFHHFLATQVGVRTLFQTPAMDPCSKWVSDCTGEITPPGVLTMRITADEPVGYSDLQIISPR